MANTGVELAGVVWTARRRTGGGWAADGCGPVRGVPPDFRPLRPLWPGDDERRWVSLERRGILLEAPGPHGGTVVRLRAYRRWAAFVAAWLAELPEAAQAEAAAAMLAVWEAGRQPAGGEGQRGRRAYGCE